MTAYVAFGVPFFLARLVLIIALICVFPWILPGCIKTVQEAPVSRHHGGAVKGPSQYDRVLCDVRGISGGVLNCVRSVNGGLPRYCQDGKRDFIHRFQSFEV